MMYLRLFYLTQQLNDAALPCSFVNDCIGRLHWERVSSFVSRLRIAISFMKVARTYAKQYIEQRGEGYWIVETRISLSLTTNYELRITNYFGSPSTLPEPVITLAIA